MCTPCSAGPAPGSAPWTRYAGSPKRCETRKRRSAGSCRGYAESVSAADDGLRIYALDAAGARYRRPRAGGDHLHPSAIRRPPRPCGAADGYRRNRALDPGFERGGRQSGALLFAAGKPQRILRLRRRHCLMADRITEPRIMGRHRRIHALRALCGLVPLRGDSDRACRDDRAGLVDAVCNRGDLYSG